MKVDRLEIKAVIPVGTYANIQPGYEMHNVDSDEGTELILTHLKGLFKRFSDKGELKENDFITYIQKMSFNEGKLVGFDPESHTYEYQGNRLTSATTYIGKFYKKFDNENISKASAKSWGVSQQDVKDLWKSNGYLTSGFGKVVHEALEHYDKFKVVGSVIALKKGLENNYCLPKHPVLRSIIEGFIAIDKTEGIVVPEALITNVERGYCGHADRVLIIDEKKKICRIQDYKININSEELDSNLKPLIPFNELPANKITKYQLQMSFYANMLEMTGWTVQGLDVFIYEDEWKHYQLEVLNVIN